nr:potassium voltage-gated channel subfamily G member 2 [Vicugna pacos]
MLDSAQRFRRVRSKGSEPSGIIRDPQEDADVRSKVPSENYDVSRDEFFFDRSPCAFRAIVALLRAGKLRLLRGPCALAFRDELAYWGIDEARLERCCLRRLRRREEEAAEARAGPAERGPPGSPDCGLGPGGRLARGRRRLRDVVDNPHSGLAGKLFACVSVAFVAVTAVGLCLSTMPDIRAEEERGECSPKCRNLFVLETVCVAWFSFEFLLPQAVGRHSARGAQCRGAAPWSSAVIVPGAVPSCSCSIAYTKLEACMSASPTSSLAAPLCPWVGSCCKLALTEESPPVPHSSLCTAGPSGGNCFLLCIGAC